MTSPQNFITPELLGSAAVILDVREPDEFSAGHIDGALGVPMNSVPQRMSSDPGELLSEEPIVVTCKAGGRASQVATWLNNNGFAAVVLDGGMLAWQAQGRPMVSDTGADPTVL